MSDPIVHRVVSGTWRQNGYVIEGAADALILDPGSDTDAFVALIERLPVRPRAILNTHAHFDHIASVAPLMETYEIPFYLHGGDADLLRQANLYRALFGEPKPLRVPPAFEDLASAEGLFRVSEFAIEVLATPGHTKGSVCFRLGEVLFTGDTLFWRGAGRIDLPGGSAVDMAKSQTFLSTLPGELLVYPGHGEKVRMRQIRERVEQN